MLPILHTTMMIQRKNTTTTQSGKLVTTLSLSVGEKNKNDEYDNFYCDATFWEKGAEFVNQYFNEGDIIEIKGDLITTHYEKDGKKIYKTEVKFPKASFPAKPKNTQSKPEYTMQDKHGKEEKFTPAPSTSAPNPIPEIDVNEDEIPF